MLTVGLTGGIAVGKSFVSSVLRELGAHVYDSDQIARDVVAPGTDGLADIVATFGEDVLLPDGTLDRPRLGSIVFGNNELREKLNGIVHPRVHAEQDRLLRGVMEADPDGIAVVDAALLIESGGWKRFDKVVVVFCRPEIQLERLMNRNGFDRAEAERRIASQMPTEEKRKYADFEIDTSNGFDDARARTQAVFQALRECALKNPPG